MKKRMVHLCLVILVSTEEARFLKKQILKKKMLFLPTSSIIHRERFFDKTREVNLSLYYLPEDQKFKIILSDGNHVKQYARSLKNHPRD